jgi:Cdc6-like AAA superfamily ATPase
MSSDFEETVTTQKMSKNINNIRTERRNKSDKTKPYSKKIKLHNWKITLCNFFFSRLFNKSLHP